MTGTTKSSAGRSKPPYRGCGAVLVGIGAPRSALAALPEDRLEGNLRFAAANSAEAEARRLDFFAKPQLRFSNHVAAQPECGAAGVALRRPRKYRDGERPTPFLEIAAN